MSTPWKIDLTIQAPTGSKAEIRAHIAEATKDAIMAALDADFKGEPVTSSHHLPDAKKMVPLTDEQINAVYREFMLYQDGLTPSGMKRVTRAIEAAHGIGSLCDSGTANTAPPCTNNRALLGAAKKLLKELDVLREAEIDKEDWMPVNEADEALVAAIAKVEGKV